MKITVVDLLNRGLLEGMPTITKEQAQILKEAILAESSRPPFAMAGGGGTQHLVFRPKTSGDQDVALAWLKELSPESAFFVAAKSMTGHLCIVSQVANIVAAAEKDGPDRPSTPGPLLAFEIA